MSSRRLIGIQLRKPLLRFFLLVVAFTALPLWAADPSTDNAKDKAAPEATINFWNRDIVTLRATVAGAGPELRAERVLERLEGLPLNARASDINTLPFVVEGQNGLAFMYQGKILFYVGANDLDKETGETLAQAGATLAAKPGRRVACALRRALLASSPFGHLIHFDRAGVADCRSLRGLDVA